MKLVHVVADYGPGDLAFAEMISALARHLPDDARWHCTPVAGFDTVATGFIVAQLALQRSDARPHELFLYANCAPRADSQTARSHNEGEGLLYVRLRNGVEMLVVNSGFSLSFVREEIDALHSVETDDTASQFRSRDAFPPRVGELVRGELDLSGRPLVRRDSIPDRPGSRLGYVDSFGNLKTTIRQGDEEIDGLREGQQLKIRVNGVSATVTVATGSFNVREHDIAFAPGSSGHDRPYWEIFQRGGNAAQIFGGPSPGTIIELLEENA